MSAPVAAAKKFTSFYRLAGMGYLDALTTASSALRRVLKEPMRAEAQSRANFKFREITYAADGKESSPLEVFSSPSMMKK